MTIKHMFGFLCTCARGNQVRAIALGTTATDCATPVAVVTAKAVEAFMHRKLGITVRAVCLPPAIVAHQ